MAPPEGQGTSEPCISPLRSSLNQGSTKRHSAHESIIESKKQRYDDDHDEQIKKKTRMEVQDACYDRRSVTRTMQLAVNSQQAKKRRLEEAAKAEEDRSAIYEAYPTLPGKQGGTQAILTRLSSESSGRPSSAMNKFCQPPCINSEGRQPAKQMGENLLTQDKAGRITKGELHAINNILNGKPRD